MDQIAYTHIKHMFNTQRLALYGWGLFMKNFIFDTIMQAFVD